MATAGQQIDGLLSKLEWRWSLSNFLIGAYFFASTALPAWAVSAMEMFQHYAPLSWVLAGFAGLVVSVVAFAVFSLAYGRWVRSRYNRRLYEKTGFVDPMAKTFEDKRIFLSEFCLPSDQFIEGKTFINCEIIGPALLYLRRDNKAYEQKLPYCDAVVLRRNRIFYNGIVLDNCTFRASSFKRITLIASEDEYPLIKDLEWLNWIGDEVQQPLIPGLEPSQAEASAPPLLEGTAKEKQP